MLKNFIFFSVSILIFFLFAFLYGSAVKGREKPLSEILVEKKIENPKIIVYIAKNFLVLYDENKEIKRYRISLGKSDFKLAKYYERYVTTPAGCFSVCNVLSSPNFYKIYKLDYPDSLTIRTAYEKKLIDKAKMSELLAKKRYGCNILNYDSEIFGPPITIHGYGKMDFILRNLPFVFNWTNGSVALCDEDLDELSPYLQIGTKVIIKD